MSNGEKNSLGPEPEKAVEQGQVTRRDFFNEVAAGALGVAAVGATIYFGSPESDQQIIEVSEASPFSPSSLRVVYQS